MEGAALVYPPGKTEPEVTKLNAPPGLEWLQKQVGGHIEVVPYFQKIEHEGARHKCIAFCNEEGKLRRLVLNTVATALWAEATGDKLFGLSGEFLDVLVGPVVIIYGDDELMAAL